MTAVINLTTYYPGHSLEGEAEWVRSSGMAYIHIPVDWADPADVESPALSASHRRALEGLCS